MLQFAYANHNDDSYQTQARLRLFPVLLPRSRMKHNNETQFRRPNFPLAAGAFHISLDGTTPVLVSQWDISIEFDRLISKKSCKEMAWELNFQLD